LTINRVAQALEDATRSRRVRGMLQGALELGRFAFAIIAILLLEKNNAEAAFGGFVLAGLLVVTLHAHYIRRIFQKPLPDQKQTGNVNRRADKSAFQSYLRPLILSNFCIWIVMMSERWVLQRCCDISDVGGYAAVYQLAFMPMVLISNFMLVLTTPILYQFIRVNSDAASTAGALRVNRYVGVAILVFSLLGSALLYQFHSDVAQIFLGPEFRPYSWIFPWLLFAGGSFAAAQQLLLRLTCDFDTLSLAKLWGFLGALSIFAYTLGAQWGQLDGVVAAVVGINGLLAIFAILLSLRNASI
jgi:O-antigen/teichoic acid export membrane protein